MCICIITVYSCGFILVFETRQVMGFKFILFVKLFFDLDCFFLLNTSTISYEYTDRKNSKRIDIIKGYSHKL